MATAAFPEPPPSITPTTFSECDTILTALQDGAKRWVEVSIEARISLLEGFIDAMVDVSNDWVAASTKAKGHQPGSGGQGEERLGGIAPTIRNARLLIEALKQGGQPKVPSLRQRADGQWVAKVMPASIFDQLLFTGVTAEIWLEPGAAPTQGKIYRDKADSRESHAAVSLVLGAGNQASIPPMDALHKLFVEDEVVLLKMNPVNEYLGPFIRRAFQAFVDLGFFEVVYGGAEIGAYLCQHPSVDSIHITGSERTHDAIVWGSDRSKHPARKASNDKVNHKRITSELGCVTPVIVVPGPWSDSDIAFQARHVASMVFHNASFNCNAAKVLVTARDWPLREKFLDAVREQLRTAAPRKAYYPGAKDRHAAFLSSYPTAEILGVDGPEVVPWTFIPGIGTDEGEYALNNEAFCGILAQVDLDGHDASTFLANAVPFCNDQLWGTLSACMLVHGKTKREHKPAVDKAVADLRYGGIALNVWPGLIYGLATPTWGAFPGHTDQDIVSGRGAVHNTFLLDHPQKSVVDAPFRIRPTPAWFHDHANLDAMAQKLVTFEQKPSWLRLPGLILEALKG